MENEAARPVAMPRPIEVPQEQPKKDTTAQNSPVDQLSTLVLVQVGLTVFNSILLLMFAVLWNINPNVLASILREWAGLVFLSGMAPAIVGVVLVRRNKGRGQEEPGLIWANIGACIGPALAIASFVIPALLTLRSMLSSEPI